MSNYNSSILKTTLRTLMNEHNTKQTAFKDIADIDQPRLSKILDPEDKALPTIEQLYKIARHFDVTIDYLVTGEDRPIGSLRKKCEALVQLFEENDLKHIVTSREETIYIPYTNYTNGCMEYDTRKEIRQVDYHALFFPVCWNINPNIEYDDTDRAELEMEIIDLGNELENNMKINKFLEAFIPIHDLMLDGRMPSGAYKLAVQSLLDTIE